MTPFIHMLMCVKQEELVFKVVLTVASQMSVCVKGDMSGPSYFVALLCRTMLHGYVTKVGSIFAELPMGIYHVGNIWIGPWANFPHYMDPTLHIMSLQGRLDYVI